MKKEHLNFNDRICIQACIEKRYGLKRTAKFVHKNVSTIYREITKNSKIIPSYVGCSHCIHKCEQKPMANNKYERFAPFKCDKFEPIKCKKWRKFPFTCNHCNLCICCHNEKRYYDCVEANEKSKKSMSTSRRIIRISKEKLGIINAITRKGILENGQSLHHCYQSSDELRFICSELTIRRYIYNGYLDVKPHHLPRFVRYKREYDYPKQKINNASRMLGRTYNDYKDFVSKHPTYNVWQYDSVLGKLSDEKTILTITYPKTRFQFGILLDQKDKAYSVQKYMRFLQSKLGEKFKEIFQINLSDNGTEFNTFHEIECNKNGEFYCRVFFTNPYRSTDKAECERNHEFIRYVIPKGISLDNLTQEKVNLLFSHINSYVRKSNQNKTPYELTVESFGPEFMDLIGIKKIPLQDVCLKRNLLI